MTNSKIFESIRNSEFSKLATYLKYKYNFKIKTEPDGNNILMVALEINDPKKRSRMFEYLLDKQLVDLNETNNRERDIFFMAVIHDCESELNILLERYFDLIEWSRMDADGKTILHHAVESNNYKILENLLLYCNKYRINVDIPDGANKITPYLLANKLNNFTAIELLVKIGNASRQQMDDKIFYDAEQWKHEGQMEAYKRYLKNKQYEMTQAKVKGNIKLYNFLNHFNSKLDKEINKNPELLPLIAKVIIDNDAPSLTTLPISKIKSTVNGSNKSTIEYFKIPKPVKSIQELPIQKPKLLKLNEIKRNQYNFSTSSSYSNSSPISSASSSSKNNKKSSSTSLTSDQLLSYRKSSSFDSLIENIIKNKQQQNGTLSSSNFNTLLEMTSGNPVDHFLDSKQDGELASSVSFQMSDLFLQKAIQNTNNYRTAAKKPVVKKEIKILPKPKPKTSTLAIIREESIKKSNKNIRKIFNSQNSLPKLNSKTINVKLKS